MRFIPSFRLKLGSLNRVLENTIEDPGENGRNRALLVILSGNPLMTLIYLLLLYLNYFHLYSNIGRIESK